MPSPIKTNISEQGIDNKMATSTVKAEIKKETSSPKPNASSSSSSTAPANKAPAPATWSVSDIRARAWKWFVNSVGNDDDDDDEESSNEEFYDEVMSKLILLLKPLCLSYAFKIMINLIFLSVMSKLELQLYSTLFITKFITYYHFQIRT